MKIFGKKVDTAELLLSLVGLAVLTALFLVWRTHHPNTEPTGVLAAFFSAAVFGVFGVRLVCAWLREWRALGAEGAPGPRVTEPVGAGVLLRVFFGCLLAEIAALLVVYAFQIVNGTRSGFWEAANVYINLDTRHYLDIAREWYLSEGDRDRLVQLVFLPGYPLAVRLFYPLAGDWLRAGFLVSVLSFSGAGVMLYRLARLDMDHDGALRTLKYTLILPGSFFFAAPMSEALFLLLSVSCVYCVRRGLCWPAGLLGGLAAFTRSLGLMLMVPMLYALITDLAVRPGGRKARKALRLLSALLVPAGFGVYCLICRQVSGDPFQFLIYQREHWSQSPGLFFNTAAYQTERILWSLRDGDFPILLGLWIPNVFCTLAALVVMSLAVRKLRPIYSAYFLAYYVMAIGTTWLLSAPRYLVACFPLSLGLASLTENRRTDAVLTVGATILYCFYSFFMAARWQVW